MSHEGQSESDDHVQEPNSEAFGAKLHAGALEEENELIGVVAVWQKHGHVPNNVVHGAGYAKEVDKEGEAHPEAIVVEHGVAGEEAA